MLLFFFFPLFIFFSCSPHLNSSPAVQISCTAVLSWSSGSLDAGGSGGRDLSLRRRNGRSPRRGRRDALGRGPAGRQRWEGGRWSKRNTCCFLQPPALSETPCFSVSPPVKSQPFRQAVSLIFFSSSSSPSSFFSGQKAFELYIGKYCIRLRYSCKLSNTWRILCTNKLAFSLFFQIMVSKEQRGFFYDLCPFFFSFFSLCHGSLRWNWSKSSVQDSQWETALTVIGGQPF